MPRALKGDDYDSLWERNEDFVRYHPGARHRRRLCACTIGHLDVTSHLDVGCGPGDFLALTTRIWPHARFSGIDLSPEVLARNRRRLPSVSFEVLDIEHDAPREQFDLVSCLEVLEHLEDRRAAFANLRAAVRPGGHLLISCPTGRLFSTERHFGHVSHPTRHEIHALAREHGMRIERMVDWGFPTYALLKRATNVNPDWALRSFSEGRYGPVKKAVSSLLYYANYFNLSSRWGCQLIVLLQRIDDNPAAADAPRA